MLKFSSWPEMFHRGNSVVHFQKYVLKEKEINACQDLSIFHSGKIKVLLKTI